MPKFSIIVTFIKTSKLLEECIYSLQKQTYQDFELILISENKISEKFLSKFSFSRIKSFLTKFTTPGEKRHEATKYANGLYYLFLDDDAHANEKLLEIYEEQIKKFQYNVMGGPAIDRLDEGKIIVKALSFLFIVRFFGGFPERYIKLKKKTVDDWPSVNFLIKKDTYNLTDGFNHKFWPGEDSLLCNEIHYKLKESIHYIPEAFVFHKRRPTIKSHIKQIFGYSNMRGKFFSKGIENSSSIKFIVPSIFLIFNLFSIIFYTMNINEILNILIFLVFSLYFSLNFILSLSAILKVNEKIYYVPLFMFANYFNHLVYGSFFLFGLIRNKLTSK